MQLDNKIRRYAAATALTAAAFMAFGSAPSFADPTTSGDGSTGGGNQLQAPVSVPVNVCGNAVGILGKAAADCDGGKSTVNENNTDDQGSPTTSGDNSTGGGNQAQAPISAPVNICGNAISGGGEAAADCDGGKSTVNENPPPDQGNNPPPDQGNNPPPDEGNNPPPDQSGDNSGDNSGDQSGDNSATNQPPPNMAPDQPAANAATDDGSAANASDNLPFTGANTAGLAAAALTALGLGALTVWFTRRRRGSAKS